MNNLDPQRRMLALALAGLAGFVDASGYLSADRYFVSFMSGNTTRLGVELARELSAALLPALLALCFVVGVFGGALLTGRLNGAHKPALLGGVAGLLAIGAGLGGAGHDRAALLALAAAMGALNNSFQRDGQVAVGLTYMTGALVRMGQGLAARVLGRNSEPWGQWLALWLALAAGGTIGALTFLNLPQATFWIAAGIALALAGLARLLPTRG
ncbi:MAG: DUF1275 family protein [Novosphingobium sp.]